MSRGVGAPPFPRAESMRGFCGLCGDRLIPGKRPGTWVHQLTDSVRCPPVQRVCSVCSKDGLVSCYYPDCGIVIHPGGGCGMACCCCFSVGCPAHVSPVDGLCLACSAHGPTPDHEVPEGGAW